MAQIFISYSRVDTEFAERLVERLRRVYGLPNVWYDDELHGGQRWWKAILEQIAQCDVFLYLLSNESVTSPYCLAEFEEARRLQKPIVTVQIRDKTQLSNELSEIQYVDMKRGLDDDKLARLIRAINEMAALPKKRRALWTPATPLPVIPHDEAQAAGRPDVTTPTLQVTAPPKMPAGDRSVARATIIGALITGLLGIIAVILSVVLPSLIDPTPTPPPTSAAQIATTPPAADEPTFDALALVAQTQTHEAGQTLTAQPTPTPPPTINRQGTLDAVASATRAHFQTAEAALSTRAAQDAAATLTAQPTPTFSPQQRALTPVARNADWTPVERDFDGVPMVLVPAGCFLMGSDDGDSDEQPVHQQCFDTPFWLDKTEVTNAQFAAFHGVAGRASQWTDANRPREQITWFEARDFCARRGARLPTEAEWEYAARGPNGWAYPWGDGWNADNVVWAGNSNSQTAAAGSRPAGASWAGALDLSGNVWEWTSSLYESYPYDAADGRERDTGNSTDVLRVLRGGSFLNTSVDLRSANRYGNIPDLVNLDLGFRCARSS